jgi:phage-related protein
VTVVGEAFINLKSGSAAEFVRDATGKIRGEGSKFEGAGKESGSKFGTGFSKESTSKVTEGAKHLALKIGALIGGAFAVHEGISYVKEALAVGEEANKTTAQTGAVIKSTGGAANVTAASVANLSQALANKTGQDHVAIQSGENLLLTFTNIRNEAGKHGAVFDRTSKAVLDLAAARHIDASAAAVQLGKAINDPAAGLSKLTRIGITFTDQQKDQIKWLQAKGNVMGAQNLILDQVNKKFGGSAEAQATATDKMKVGLKELKESLGKAILPAIDSLLPAFSTALKAIQPALTALGGVIGSAFKAIGPALAAASRAVAPILNQMGKAIHVLAPAIAPLVAAFGSIAKALAPLLPVVARVFGALLRAVTPIVQAIGKSLGPIIAKLAPLITKVLGAVTPLFSKLGGIFAQLIKTAAPIFMSLLDALTPILPLIGKLVATVGGAFLGAISQLLPPIGQLIDALVKALAPILPVIVDAMVQVFAAIQPLLPVIVDLVKGLGPSLGAVIKALAPALASIAKALGDLLVALLPILTPILKLATLLIVKIGAPLLVKIAQAVGFLATALAKIVDVIAKVIGAFTHLDFGAVGRAIGNVVSTIVGFFMSLPDKISHAAAGLFDGVVGFAEKLPGRIWDFIKTIPTKVTDLADKMLTAGTTLGGKILHGILSGMSGLVHAAGKLIDGLGGAIKSLGEGIINGLIDVVNKILSHVHIGKIKVAGYTIFDGIGFGEHTIPHVKFATGGIAKAQPGGILANIAEAGRDEAVLPLLPGVLAGLARIGQGAARPGQGGVHVGQIVVPERDSPVQHALDILDRIEAERYLQGAL